MLAEDYIVHCQGQGVALADDDRPHALRNALIPALTLIGLQFGFLLGGTVVTETVFSAGHRPVGDRCDSVEGFPRRAGRCAVFGDRLYAVEHRR